MAQGPVPVTAPHGDAAGRQVEIENFRREPDCFDNSTQDLRLFGKFPQLEQTLRHLDDLRNENHIAFLENPLFEVPSHKLSEHVKSMTLTDLLNWSLFLERALMDPEAGLKKESMNLKRAIDKRLFEKRKDLPWKGNFFSSEHLIVWDALFASRADTLAAAEEILKKNAAGFDRQLISKHASPFKLWTLWALNKEHLKKLGVIKEQHPETEAEKKSDQKPLPYYQAEMLREHILSSFEEESERSLQTARKLLPFRLPPEDLRDLDGPAERERLLAQERNWFCEVKKSEATPSPAFQLRTLSSFIHHYLSTLGISTAGGLPIQLRTRLESLVLKPEGARILTVAVVAKDKADLDAVARLIYSGMIEPGLSQLERKFADAISKEKDPQARREALAKILLFSGAPVPVPTDGTFFKGAAAMLRQQAAHELAHEGERYQKESPLRYAALHELIGLIDNRKTTPETLRHEITQRQKYGDRYFLIHQTAEKLKPLGRELSAEEEEILSRMQDPLGEVKQDKNANVEEQEASSQDQKFMSSIATLQLVAETSPWLAPAIEISRSGIGLNLSKMNAFGLLPLPTDAPKFQRDHLIEQNKKELNWIIQLLEHEPKKVFKTRQSLFRFLDKHYAGFKGGESLTRHQCGEPCPASQLSAPLTALDISEAIRLLNWQRIAYELSDKLPANGIVPTPTPKQENQTLASLLTRRAQTAEIELAYINEAFNARDKVKQVSPQDYRDTWYSIDHEIKHLENHLTRDPAVVYAKKSLLDTLRKTKHLLEDKRFGEKRGLEDHSNSLGDEVTITFLGDLKHKREPLTMSAKAFRESTNAGKSDWIADPTSLDSHVDTYLKAKSEKWAATLDPKQMNQEIDYVWSLLGRTRWWVLPPGAVYQTLVDFAVTRPKDFEMITRVMYYLENHPDGMSRHPGIQHSFPAIKEGLRRYYSLSSNPNDVVIVYPHAPSNVKSIAQEIQLRARQGGQGEQAVHQQMVELAKKDPKTFAVLHDWFRHFPSKNHARNAVLSVFAPPHIQQYLIGPKANSRLTGIYDELPKDAVAEEWAFYDAYSAHDPQFLKEQTLDKVLDRLSKRLDAFRAKTAGEPGPMAPMKLASNKEAEAAQNLFRAIVEKRILPALNAKDDREAIKAILQGPNLSDFDELFEKAAEDGRLRQNDEVTILGYGLERDPGILKEQIETLKRYSQTRNPDLLKQSPALKNIVEQADIHHNNLNRIINELETARRGLEHTERVDVIKAKTLETTRDYLASQLRLIEKHAGASSPIAGLDPSLARVIAGKTGADLERVAAALSISIDGIDRHLKENADDYIDPYFPVQVIAQHGENGSNNENGERRANLSQRRIADSSPDFYWRGLKGYEDFLAYGHSAYNMPFFGISPESRDAIKDLPPFLFDMLHSSVVDENGIPKRYRGKEKLPEEHRSIAEAETEALAKLIHAPWPAAIMNTVFRFDDLRNNYASRLQRLLTERLNYVENEIARLKPAHALSKNAAEEQQFRDYAARLAEYNALGVALGRMKQQPPWATKYRGVPGAIRNWKHLSLDEREAIRQWAGDNLILLLQKDGSLLRPSVRNDPKSLELEARKLWKNGKSINPRENDFMTQVLTMLGAAIEESGDSETGREAVIMEASKLGKEKPTPFAKLRFEPHFRAAQLEKEAALKAEVRQRFTYPGKPANPEDDVNHQAEMRHILDSLYRPDDPKSLSLIQRQQIYRMRKSDFSRLAELEHQLSKVLPAQGVKGTQEILRRTQRNLDPSVIKDALNLWAPDLARFHAMEDVQIPHRRDEAVAHLAETGKLTDEDRGTIEMLALLRLSEDWLPKWLASMGDQIDRLSSEEFSKKMAEAQKDALVNLRKSTEEDLRSEAVVRILTQARKHFIEEYKQQEPEEVEKSPQEAEKKAGDYAAEMIDKIVSNRFMILPEHSHLEGAPEAGPAREKELAEERAFFKQHGPLMDSLRRALGVERYEEMLAGDEKVLANIQSPSQRESMRASLEFEHDKAKADATLRASRAHFHVLDSEEVPDKVFSKKAEDLYKEWNALVEERKKKRQEQLSEEDPEIKHFKEKVDARHENEEDEEIKLRTDLQRKVHDLKVQESKLARIVNQQEGWPVEMAKLSAAERERYLSKLSVAERKRLLAEKEKLIRDYLDDEKYPDEVRLQIDAARDDIYTSVERQHRVVNSAYLKLAQFLNQKGKADEADFQEFTKLNETLEKKQNDKAVLEGLKAKAEAEKTLIDFLKDHAADAELIPGLDANQPGVQFRKDLSVQKLKRYFEMRERLEKLGKLLATEGGDWKQSFLLNEEHGPWRDAGTRSTLGFRMPDEQRHAIVQEAHDKEETRLKALKPILTQLEKWGIESDELDLDYHASRLYLSSEGELKKALDNVSSYLPEMPTLTGVPKKRNAYQELEDGVVKMWKSQGEPALFEFNSTTAASVQRLGKGKYKFQFYDLGRLRKLATTELVAPLVALFKENSKIAGRLRADHQKIYRRDRQELEAALSANLAQIHDLNQKLARYGNVRLNIDGEIYLVAEDAAPGESGGKRSLRLVKYTGIPPRRAPENAPLNQLFATQIADNFDYELKHGVKVDINHTLKLTGYDLDAKYRSWAIEAAGWLLPVAKVSKGPKLLKWATRLMNPVQMDMETAAASRWLLPRTIATPWGQHLIGSLRTATNLHALGTAWQTDGSRSGPDEEPMAYNHTQGEIQMLQSMLVFTLAHPISTAARALFHMKEGLSFGQSFAKVWTGAPDLESLRFLQEKGASFLGGLGSHTAVHTAYDQLMTHKELGKSLARNFSDGIHTGALMMGMDQFAAGLWKVNFPRIPYRLRFINEMINPALRFATVGGFLAATDISSASYQAWEAQEALQKMRERIEEEPDPRERQKQLDDLAKREAETQWATMVRHALYQGIPTYLYFGLPTVFGHEGQLADSRNRLLRAGTKYQGKTGLEVLTVASQKALQRGNPAEWKKIIQGISTKDAMRVYYRANGTEPPTISRGGSRHAGFPVSENVQRENRQLLAALAKSANMTPARFEAVLEERLQKTQSADYRGLPEASPELLKLIPELKDVPGQTRGQQTVATEQKNAAEGIEINANEHLARHALPQNEPIARLLPHFQAGAVQKIRHEIETWDGRDVVKRNALFSELLEITPHAYEQVPIWDPRISKDVVRLAVYQAGASQYPHDKAAAEEFARFLGRFVQHYQLPVKVARNEKIRPELIWNNRILRDFFEGATSFEKQYSLVITRKLTPEAVREIYGDPSYWMLLIRLARRDRLDPEAFLKFAQEELQEPGQGTYESAKKKYHDPSHSIQLAEIGIQDFSHEPHSPGPVISRSPAKIRSALLNTGTGASNLGRLLDRSVSEEQRAKAVLPIPIAKIKSSLSEGETLREKLHDPEQKARALASSQRLRDALALAAGIPREVFDAAFRQFLKDDAGASDGKLFKDLIKPIQRLAIPRLRQIAQGSDSKAHAAAEALVKLYGVVTDPTILYPLSFSAINRVPGKTARQGQLELTPADSHSARVLNAIAKKEGFDPAGFTRFAMSYLSDPGVSVSQVIRDYQSVQDPAQPGTWNAAALKKLILGPQYRIAWHSIPEDARHLIKSQLSVLDAAWMVIPPRSQRRGGGDAQLLSAMRETAGFTPQQLGISPVHAELAFERYLIQYYQGVHITKGKKSAASDPSNEAFKHQRQHETLRDAGRHMLALYHFDQGQTE